MKLKTPKSETDIRQKAPKLSEKEILLVGNFPF